MRVYRKVYELDCPNCHSALCAEPMDLKFNKFTVGFKCPVCGKECRILRPFVRSVTTIDRK